MSSSEVMMVFLGDKNGDSCQDVAVLEMLQMNAEVSMNTLVSSLGK